MQTEKVCLLPLKTNETDKKIERKREKITMAETSNTETFICDFQKLRPLIKLEFAINQRNHELVKMNEEFGTNIEITKLLELKIDNTDSPCPRFGEELQYTVLKFNPTLFINQMKDSMLKYVKDNFSTGENDSRHVDGWRDREEGIDMILKDSTVHTIIHDESEDILTTHDLRMAFERSYTAFKDRKRLNPNNNLALIYPNMTFTLGIKRIYPHLYNQFDPRNLFCYTHHLMRSQIPSYDRQELQVASNCDTIIGDNNNGPIVADVVTSHTVVSSHAVASRVCVAATSSTTMINAVPVRLPMAADITTVPATVAANDADTVTTLPKQITGLVLSLPKSTQSDDENISNGDSSSSLDTQLSDFNRDVPITSNKESSTTKKRKGPTTVGGETEDGVDPEVANQGGMLQPSPKAPPPSSSSTTKKRKMKEWTDAEVTILVEKHKALLGNWKEIAKCFPGRSLDSVYMKWQRYMNNTKTKKNGKKMDPNVPKIALNPYLIYCAHIRPSVKEENPEASFGDIKELDDDQRKIFVERAKVDSARYRSEMANYVGHNESFEDRRGKAPARFPTRLYDLLENANAAEYADVISWYEDGTSFRIHTSCDTDIVPILKQKYKSFLRQLQHYGFKRQYKDSLEGIYRHPLFVRRQRVLLHNKSIADFQTAARTSERSSVLTAIHEDKCTNGLTNEVRFELCVEFRRQKFTEKNPLSMADFLEDHKSKLVSKSNRSIMNDFNHKNAVALATEVSKQLQMDRIPVRRRCHHHNHKTS